MVVALLEKLKKEWHVIKAAPWSFLIVCAVAMATIGGAFRYVYREKLADSDRRANQWKSDAEYWKDVANRKEKSDSPLGLQNTPVPKPSRPTNSVTNPQGSIVNQGSPNYGTQIIAPLDRKLSEIQKSKLAAFTETLPQNLNVNVQGDGTSEPQAYAAQIYEVLHSRTQKIIYWTPQIPMGNQPKGIAVITQTLPNKWATAIAGILNAELVSDERTPENQLWIVVGKRP